MDHFFYKINLLNIFETYKFTNVEENAKYF